MSNKVNQQTEEAKKKNQFVETIKRLLSIKSAAVGLILLVIIVLLCVMAPVIAPYDYATPDVPARFAHPNAEHIFGCDELGRDIFSRILYGGRFSLQIGIIAAGSAVLMGIVIGAISGYCGGWIDNIIMRFLDVISSIPGLLMSVAISAVLGNGLYETTIALAIGQTATCARVLRGSILTVSGVEYIDAAKADNTKAFRIITKHLLPNAISPVIVQGTMGCARAILTAASLSFIGLGVQPPNPEWGAMLSGGRSYIRDHPHIILFPGLAIALTVLCLNLLGDGLRDALDPKLRK